MRRLILASLLVTLACGQRAEQSGGAPAVQERVGRVDLSIGQVDGPPQYTFGQVSGLAEAPTGEIYVSDGQANTIRVFDSHGAFLRTIGREGRGPSEMELPCCIAFGPNQLLWVRDGGNRRYDSYAVGGDSAKSAGSVQMVHMDGAFFTPITFMPGGELVDVGHEMGKSGEVQLWRAVLARDGREESRTLVPEPSAEALGTVVKEQTVSGGMARYYFPQPFGPASLVAHGPDGVWATAVSSQYLITLHHDTTTLEIRGTIENGPVLSSQERDRAAQRLQAYVRRGGGRPSDYPAIPSRKPPLADIFFDTTGRLWVQMSVPEDSAQHADLYDAKGSLIGRRSWPASVSLRFPAWVGADQALGTATDSLGVQRVVRLSFE